MVKQRDNLHVSGKTNEIMTVLVKQTVQWADLCERVSLKAGQELFSCGSRSPFIYLPIDAVVSLTATSGGLKPNGKPLPAVTVAVLGSGDIVGVGQISGATESAATSPVAAIVDMGGYALRCSAQAARRLMAENRHSLDVVLAYQNLAMAESWQWLTASVQLPVAPRVAAYLLIHWQTSKSEMLPVTHLSMADRMAIRRPSVTEALGELVSQGVIRQSDRGRIDVSDPQRLVSIVREAWPLYGAHRKAFWDALSLA